jgi:hypothetical protein
MIAKGDKGAKAFRLMIGTKRRLKLYFEDSSAGIQQRELGSRDYTLAPEVR